MATSSANDVFIDFSGMDTRYSFVSHLSAAFRRRNISVLLSKDGSDVVFAKFKVFVVVFSENYASSPQCLDTLAKFLELKVEGLVVVPVYYGGVTRFMVEQQTERFGEAFSKHQNLYSQDRVTKWRNSLITTASLPGHESNDQRKDSEFVEEIVADVREKLAPMGKIGIYSRLLEIENWVFKQSRDISLLGIWGMPGIGKTAIAKEAFKQMSKDFYASFLVQDFHMEYHRKGLYKLRSEHLKKILPALEPVTESSLFLEKLRGKRVLFVLDDVRSPMDAESFLGGFKWLCHGSFIIITSRDKQVLHQCQIDDIYQVPSLNKSEALRLFTRTVKEEPSDAKLMELSKNILDYANGNPKALCFYGGKLREKKKKPEEFEADFERMKQCPPQEILSLFKSSFDALNDNERSIFLDVACFFKGEPRDRVMQILEGCGFFPHVGIERLAEQSLLTISEEKTVEMHSLIQDVAREFINHVSSRRRLWEPSRIRLLLETNESKGSEVIEGIFLDTRNLSFHVKPMAFENMYNLRLLKIYSSSSEAAQEVHIPEGLHSLPYELRLLHWEKYPLQTLPQDFDPSHLVELNMPYSQLQNLWGGTKSLAKLKIINLSHSKQLVEVDELSKASNLEKINLQGCKNLKRIPHTERLRNLQLLNLSGCTKITRTDIIEKIKGLDLEGGLRETKSESMVYTTLVKLEPEDNTKSFEEK